MALKRCRVYYSGRVQGVGFRFTTQRLAQEFAVVGSVRNLEDGRVELVVEGEPAVVDAFLDSVTRALGRYIRDTRIEDHLPEDPPLQDFSISY